MLRRGGLMGFVLLVVASSVVASAPAAIAATPLPPMAGRIDSSFGGGLVTADMTPGWDWGEAVAVQPDGKVVVAGSFNGDGTYASWDAGVMRLNATGSIDTSFATGGKLILDKAGNWDEAKAVLVQPDGKIVVAGVTTPADSSASQGFVLRLLANGQLDPAFQGGLVELPLGTEIRDAVLTASGDIVVSGWSNQDLLTARLRPDGTLDAGFGQGGIATFATPGFAGDALVLQPDGGVVVVGNATGPLGSAAALVLRFTSEGVPDPQFGTGGFVRTPVGSDARPRRAEIRDVAIDTLGRIVLAGTAWLDEDSVFPIAGSLVLGEPGTRSKRFIDTDVALLRYLPDGTPDPSLGGGGKLIVPIPLTVPDARPPGLREDMSGTAQRESRGYGLAIDPQGRLLVAGAVGQPAYVAAVMRFTAGGLLDPTFGVGGVSAVAQPFDMYNPSATYLTDLTLLPDGRMVTTGRTHDATKHAVVVGRFLPGTGTTSVWSWGWNGVGQLGDGTKSDRRTPVRTQGLSGVVSVSAGAHHTLALKGDGTVWAWGWNAVGQVGDGSEVDRPSPVQVPGLEGVVAVAAGYYHSLALKGDGTVWAWGWNPVGQLGDGTTETRLSPVRLTGLTGAASIAAGALHSLAADDNGSLWGWGWNGLGQVGDGTTALRLMPTAVPLYQWTSIVGAGAFNSLSIASQTHSYRWGWIGQAGVDLSLTDPRPNSLAFHTLRVSGGGYHSLLLQDNGEILAMGNNVVGQLGDGTTSSAGLPSAVPGLKANEVSAGTLHSLAVATDGTVRAWGWNILGQLGTGSTADSLRPVAVSGLTNATSVAAGYLHSVAVRVS